MSCTVDREAGGGRFAIAGLELKRSLASQSLVNSFFKQVLFPQHFLHINPGHLYGSLNKYYLSFLTSFTYLLLNSHSLTSTHMSSTPGWDKFMGHDQQGFYVLNSIVETKS